MTIELPITVHAEYNPRQYIQRTGNEIIVDETKIDIWQTFDQRLIPDWQPEIELDSYLQQKRIRFDLETTGEPSAENRIIYIGVKIIQGDHVEYHYIQDPREDVMLLDFFHLINDHSDAIFLSSYNGFEFDWSFIHLKTELYGLQAVTPFYVEDRQTVFRIAQIWSGNPATYHATKFLDRRKTAIVDLFHQILAWDFVARKLDTGRGGRSLKNVPVVLKLRKTDRVELSYSELLEAYKTAEGMETVKAYLKDDLDDTDLLGTFLEPAIYYQQLFLPKWPLQSISVGGNGTKWNDCLKRHYQAKPVIEYVPTIDEAFLLNGEEQQFEEIKTNRLEYFHEQTGELIEIAPDNKLRYKGALTFARAGVHVNVSKYDFESLYPHVQLIYGIGTRKDPDMIQLAILKYILTERLKLKAMKEAKTIKVEDIQREASLKVFANSSYGFTGAGHICFNDMEAAALITGYARALYSYVMGLIEEYDREVAPVKAITCDTDGFAVAIKPGHETKLRDYIVSRLPEGFKLKLEWHEPLVFIPPDSERKRTITDNDQETDIGGLKKNYIIIKKNGSIESKGRFRKRDQSKLNRTFQPELLQIYHSRGYNAARNHYFELRDKCIKGELSKDLLRVTRKVRANESEVENLGLVYLADDGKGRMTTYYEGDLEVKIRMTKKGEPHKADLKKAAGINTVKTNTEPYSIKYYLNELETMYNEIFQFLSNPND